MRELTIAVLFFDRMGLLRHCLQMLKKLKHRRKICFKAYGDAGYHPDANQIFAKIMPDCELVAPSRRLGANRLVRRILSDYAQNPLSRRLLVLDSDMIVRTDLAEIVFGWPARDDMLISVYNSCLHEAFYASDAPFLHKGSFGSTGTHWTPKLAQMVLDGIPEGDNLMIVSATFFVRKAFRCVAATSHSSSISDLAVPTIAVSDVLTTV